MPAGIAMAPYCCPILPSIGVLLWIKLDARLEYYIYSEAFLLYSSHLDALLQELLQTSADTVDTY